MAAYIANANTSQVGADFTLTTDSASLVMHDATTNTRLPRGASARIQVKDAALNYHDIGALDADNPMLVVAGAGIYRVITAAGYNLGVDKS